MIEKMQKFTLCIFLLVGILYGIYLNESREIKKEVPQYVSTVKFNDEFYYDDRTFSIKVEGSYVGKINSSVPEGTKPEENFQTNSEELKGCELYQSKDHPDVIFLKKTLKLENTTSESIILKRGLKSVQQEIEDGNDDIYNIIRYVGREYSYLGSKKHLPKGYQFKDKIKYYESPIPTFNFGTNTGIYFGKDIYTNGDNILIYIKMKEKTYDVFTYSTSGALLK